MTRSWIVFMVIYPLVVAAGILVTVWIVVDADKEGSATRKQRATATSKPSQVVEALWLSEDALVEERMREFDDTISVITGSLRHDLQETYWRCSERSIEIEQQTGDNQWKVVTTVFSTRKDEDPARIRYFVVKEGGQWLIDEIRLECPKCKGSKTQTCYMCDGKGWRAYSGKCDTCGGTGQTPCYACDGKGFISLHPGVNPFYYVELYAKSD